MKTDIDIQQELYHYIKASDIKDAIGGEIRYVPRSKLATTEDCVISVLDNLNGQIQDAIVNVNIYVANISNRGGSVANIPRLQTLAELCSTVLEDVYIDTYWFRLSKQRILPVEGKDEYVINNKLMYKNSNDK